MAPPKPHPEEDDGFPTGPLISLALCRIVEPIAFMSILAYTFVMVQSFPQVNETNASFYAGLIISAFAVAEAATAMFWGGISDHYGRRPVILFGLTGTALSCLTFGFATNLWVALGARVVGGLLNGNMAVMQTMVAEMCTKPEYEARAYAMPPFMWSLGTIIGSAMGGYLAEPSKYYPDMFPPDGIFGKFPYLLPNLVTFIFILLAILQGLFFLKETHPTLRLRSKVQQEETQYHEEDADETTPLQPTLSRSAQRRASVIDMISTGPRRPSFISGSMPAMSEPGFDLRRGSVATLYEIPSIKPTPLQREQLATADDTSAPPIKAFSRSVILWITAAAILCYHQMSFGSLLPVYILDEPHSSKGIDLIGGLGYSVHDVGSFMSVNGVLALIIQGTIFPLFLSRVGVWRSMVILLILLPLIYAVVPLVSLLPRPLLPYGIYTILVLQNICQIVVYPCILITIKNATPSSTVLGRVNGLAMSACSAARTVSPPLAGIIYGTAGSAIAWWSTAAFAVIGVIELCFLSNPEGGAKVAVQNVFRRQSTAMEEAVSDD